MSTNEIASPDEALSYNEVAKMVGLVRRSIYRLVDEGKFPAPIRSGERRVVFMRSEVEQYLRERRAK